MNDPLGLFEDDKDPLGLFEDEAPQGASFTDKLKGVGEAALSTATGLTSGALGLAGGFLGGLAGAAATGKFDPNEIERSAVEGMEKLTYAPKTEKGQEYTEDVGKLMQEFIPVAGVMHTLPPVTRRPGIPKVTSESPVAKLDLLDQIPTEKPKAPMEQLELPLTSSVEQIAAERAKASPQGDLFTGTNKDLTPSPRPVEAPLETTAQHPLFDQPEMGRVANPYEAALGDWRIDENGIPIKADLSMELQNLQNPLQRNLWGDELQPTRPPEGMGLQGVITDQPQGGRPLTEAIDSMPWAQRRGAINRELTGEVPASGELQSAVIEATPERVIPKGQRGAVNPEVFAEGYSKIKELANGIRLWLVGGEEGPTVLALDKDGNQVGMTQFNRDNFTKEMNPYNDKLYSTWTETEGAPNQNLAAEMYRFAAENGNDIIPANVQTPAGKHMWEKFEKQGISKGQVIRAIPRSQRGAIRVDWSTATRDKNAPEVIEAGRSLDRGRATQAIGKVIPGLEWARPKFDSPDKVLAAAPKAKDIGPVQKALGKTVKPGIRSMRASTDNPLINFVGEMTSRNFSESDNLARQYITDKKTGIGSLYQKLNDRELAETWSAIRKGDQKQRQYTPDELRGAGFNEKQIAVIEKYYEMDGRLLDEQNDALLSTGQEAIKPRKGHAPGVFMGDYYSLVMDADNKPIGYIGSDTKWQYDRVVKDIKAQYPGAKITSMNRRSLGGSGPRSDLLSGQRDLLNLLAKNDPKLAEVQAVIDLRNAQHADAYADHALAKKGIFGSEGNKPWKSDVENAKEFFKTYFKFWEESILSSKLMKTQTDVKSLLLNPELDHMPRAKDYVADYMDGLTGRGTGKWGDALNSGIDAMADTINVGPSYARETFNQANKRLGQQAMGWFNLPFMGVQFLQIAQTAMPEFVKTAQSIKSPLSLVEATTLAVKDVLGTIPEAFGKEAIADARTKQVYDYAKSRGLFTFSEFEDVNKVTQSPASRKYDTVVDLTRQIGEQGTRPYVFFTFVRMLERSDLPRAEILDTAYNLTQKTMYDYSQRERPMVFRKMGQVGQLSGSLQTFSFNYLDQMGGWIKDAAKGNPIPLMTGGAVALALAGVGGLPFYQEADELFKLFTNQTIKDVTLPKSGEWAKYADMIQYGVLSDYTGVNFQSRAGAADVLPNSVAEAVTPYASTIGKMAGAVKEMATERDALSLKNAARAFAPSSARGMIENALMTETNPQTGVSYTTNRFGQTDYPRTSSEQKLRNYNLMSLDETKYKTNIFEGREKLKSDKDRQTAIERKIERAVVQAAPIGLTPEATQARMQAYTQSQDFKELVQEYIARGGNPKKISELITKDVMQGTRLTSKQRAEGTQLKSLEDIHRYKTFNP